MCGVPQNLFVPICSAVDKLDKLQWKDVRAEMTMKGLDEEKADAIWEILSIKEETPMAVLEKLKAHAGLSASESAKTAVAELELLFKYCGFFGSADVLQLDLTLARGLSYYTGMILEAVLVDSKVHVGSVGGGGRYDNLVGRFKKKGDVPCVGFSIGVERLFTVMAELHKDRWSAASKTHTVVLVASVEQGHLEERMQLVSECWAAGVAAELLLKETPKIQAQLKYAEAQRIPFALLFGPDELKNGDVKLKNLSNGEQKVMKRSEAIAFLKTVDASAPPTTNIVNNNNRDNTEKGK